jgi:hypothetical protein
MQELPKPKKPAKTPIPAPSQQKKYTPTRQPHLEKKSSEPKPLSRIENTRVESRIEKHKFSSSIENHYGIRQDAYSLVKGSVSNRALQTLSGIKSKKDMVILHELISAPKAFKQ